MSYHMKSKYSNVSQIRLQIISCSLLSFKDLKRKETVYELETQKQVSRVGYGIVGIHHPDYH